MYKIFRNATVSRRQPQEGRWWLRGSVPGAALLLEERSWGKGLCTGHPPSLQPCGGAAPSQWSFSMQHCDQAHIFLNERIRPWYSAS